VLGKVADEEKIEVSDAEIDAELKKLVQGSDKKEEVEKRLDSAQVRGSMEQLLATRKTIQRLVEIAGGSKDAQEK